jgi:hypothetical protein
MYVTFSLCNKKEEEINCNLAFDRRRCYNYGDFNYFSIFECNSKKYSHGLLPSLVILEFIYKLSTYYRFYPFGLNILKKENHGQIFIKIE